MPTMTKKRTQRTITKVDIAKAVAKARGEWDIKRDRLEAELAQWRTMGVTLLGWADRTTDAPGRLRAAINMARTLLADDKRTDDDGYDGC